MQALYRKFPSTLLQFEDFSSDKASTILAKYRDNVLCFNDDIQGTGATVLAGVLGALRMTAKPPEAIANLKVAVVGAGSAGIGVAQSLHSAMVEAGCVGGRAAAAKNFMVFDKDEDGVGLTIKFPDPSSSYQGNYIEFPDGESGTELTTTLLCRNLRAETAPDSLVRDITLPDARSEAAVIKLINCEGL